MSTLPSLDIAQQQFADTIAQGPSACPDGLFSGTTGQVLRGLKVHANTISYARLVALEETFPRTRKTIGAEAFNTLSRGYFEIGNGRNQSLDQLGAGFPAWLELNEVAPRVAALSRFEWLWLESYRAADTAPLQARDLIDASARDVLAKYFQCHPAARLINDEAGVSELLKLQGVGGWLLIARPEADVLVHRVDQAVATLFINLGTFTSLAQVFETFSAAQPDSDMSAAMQFLIAAGALAKVDL